MKKNFDIRTVLSLSSLVNLNDTEEDVLELVEHLLGYPLDFYSILNNCDLWREELLKQHNLLETPSNQLFEWINTINLEKNFTTAKALKILNAEVDTLISGYSLPKTLEIKPMVNPPSIYELA